MTRPAVPRVQLITDTWVQKRYSHLELARLAREGGAMAVQVRIKNLDEAHRHELAQIAEALAGSPTLLLVNDHVDVVVALNAAGAHVGQDDLSPIEARRRLGPHRLLGATVHSEAELNAVRGLDVDYIGVGPVFGTRSKQWATGQLPPLGLDGLRRLCNLSPYPVIAIGSIDRSNLASVLEQGAYGVAVLSAFAAADDPKQEAMAWSEAMYAAR